MKDSGGPNAAQSGNQGEGRSGGWPSRSQDDIARKGGTTWSRKTTDRGQWKALMEGDILQWK